MEEEEEEEGKEGEEGEEEEEGWMSINGRWLLRCTTTIILLKVSSHSLENRNRNERKEDIILCILIVIYNYMSRTLSSLTIFNIFNSILEIFT